MEGYDTDEYDQYYTALITPFAPESYELDEQAMRDLIDFYNDNNSFREKGGFIVNPEAGEIFYLTREERIQNIETVMDAAGDDQKVFAGVSGVRPDELQQAAKDAVQAGADGLFVMPPMGTIEVTDALDPVNNPEIWVEHVDRIASVADVPLIIHPTGPPSAGYGGGLPKETAEKVLEEIPTVVGWKMTYNASGWKKISKVIRSLNRHVAILGARATFFHEALSHGYLDGTVTGHLNCALEPMMEHFEAWEQDDVVRAREVYGEMEELLEYIRHRPRLHIRYKTAAWLQGITPHPYMRDPMPDPWPEEIDAIYDLLQDTGLNTISRDEVESLEPVN